MRVAAIDVGSNSIHMVIAEVDGEGRFQVLNRAKEMVRLGLRSLNSGRLSRRAIDDGLRTLDAFYTLAQRQKVSRFAAVATSAVREASNGGDFVQLVKEQVGLRVRVIPGIEEARLIHLGVCYAVDLENKPAVILDIGGGSAEVVLTNGGEVSHLWSTKLGVARLSEELAKSEPPSSKILRRIRERFEDELGKVLDGYAATGVDTLVGTSGTMLNLLSMTGHQIGQPPGNHLNQFSVTSEQFSRNCRRIAKSNRIERSRMAGLDSKRVDLIVPGAYLADFVASRLGVSQVTGCTWALREGVLLDFIHRHRKGIEESERLSDPRRRSTVRFMRHLGDDGRHGEHVARLALELFDQIHQSFDDLQLPPKAREWLEYAALMHDIGHRIRHKGHQRHSYYLISNAELLGFTREEIEVIALIARYHRKSMPKATDAGMRELGKDLARTVEMMSAIIRVADALDRTHYGVVHHLRVTVGRAAIKINLTTGANDAELEVWEAERRSRLLEELLGRKISFEIQKKKHAEKSASLSR